MCRVVGREFGVLGLSIVDYFDNDIGGVERCLRPFDPLLLYGISSGADTCGVGQLDRHALDSNRLSDDIACGPRNVGDDSYRLIR